MDDDDVLSQANVTVDDEADSTADATQEDSGLEQDLGARDAFEVVDSGVDRVLVPLLHINTGSTAGTEVEVAYTEEDGGGGGLTFKIGPFGAGAKAKVTTETGLTVKAASGVIATAYLELSCPWTLYRRRDNDDWRKLVVEQPVSGPTRVVRRPGLPPEPAEVFHVSEIIGDDPTGLKLEQTLTQSIEKSTSFEIGIDIKGVKAGWSVESARSTEITLTAVVPDGTAQRVEWLRAPAGVRVVPTTQ